MYTCVDRGSNNALQASEGPLDMGEALKELLTQGERERSTQSYEFGRSKIRRAVPGRKKESVGTSYGVWPQKLDCKIRIKGSAGTAFFAKWRGGGCR